MAPPEADTVAVPDAWQRLAVGVTELITSGEEAGHWAFAVYYPIGCLYTGSYAG